MKPTYNLTTIEQSPNCIFAAQHPRNPWLFVGCNFRLDVFHLEEKRLVTSYGHIFNHPFPCPEYAIINLLFSTDGSTLFTLSVAGMAVIATFGICFVLLIN